MLGSEAGGQGRTHARGQSRQTQAKDAATGGTRQFGKERRIRTVLAAEDVALAGPTPFGRTKDAIGHIADIDEVVAAAEDERDAAAPETLAERAEFASRKILRTDEARRVDHNDFRAAESAEAKDVLFGVPLGVDVSDSTRAEIPFGRLRQ